MNAPIISAPTTTGHGNAVRNVVRECAFILDPKLTLTGVTQSWGTTAKAPDASSFKTQVFDFNSLYRNAITNFNCFLGELRSLVLELAQRRQGSDKYDRFGTLGANSGSIEVDFPDLNVSTYIFSHEKSNGPAITNSSTDVSRRDFDDRGHQHAILKSSDTIVTNN